MSAWRARFGNGEESAHKYNLDPVEGGLSRQQTSTPIALRLRTLLRCHMDRAILLLQLGVPTG
jgi:hypothetical protein